MTLRQINATIIEAGGFIGVYEYLCALGYQKEKPETLEITVETLPGKVLKDFRLYTKESEALERS